MESLLPAFCFAATLVLATPPALNVPDPARSDVPACLTFCPTGDMNVHIVVRDFNGNTVANCPVVLDFSGCPAFSRCAPTARDPYRIDDANKTVSWVTNAIGVVDFPVRMGGTCPDGGVRVTACGVLLRLCSLASPDQDGSLVVDDADTTIAGAKRNSSDPTADFDCDGVVSDADVAVVEAHRRHACDLPTFGRRTNWGRLKIRYR
jgi:hypothetical protein